MDVGQSAKAIGSAACREPGVWARKLVSACPKSRTCGSKGLASRAQEPASESRQTCMNSNGAPVGSGSRSRMTPGGMKLNIWLVISGGTGKAMGCVRGKGKCTAVVRKNPHCHSEAEIFDNHHIETGTIKLGDGVGTPRSTSRCQTSYQ